MSTEVEQFQIVNISYKTPTKNVQKITQHTSASPKSLSTNDNSFEKEQHSCKEPDDILENLLSFFEYQVLTPSTSELYQSNIALEETRRIFGSSLSPQSNSTQKSASDLTICESKILQDVRTTVMIKNIPRHITPALLRLELDLNFRNQFDFIYMPFDLTMNINSGYAFVNFSCPSVVYRFYYMYNGKGWQTFQKEKPCILRYARQQGRRDLINQLQE